MYGLKGKRYSAYPKAKKGVSLKTGTGLTPFSLTQYS